MASARYAFAKSVREVRFLLCQTSEHSAAARSFIGRAYPVMRKHNPEIPIMIREAAGTLPRVYARYELGAETAKPLDGLTDQEIEAAVSELVRAPVALAEGGASQSGGTG